LPNLQKMKKPKHVLRIGVLNNFNHTDSEIAAIQVWQDKGYKCFVNSNSKTTLKASAGPCMITVNPDLDRFVEPTGELQNVKAARVKFVASPTGSVRDAWNQSMAWCRAHGIPALVTVQRFACHSTLAMYSTRPDLYEWKNSYYRLKKVPDFQGLELCDREAGGCPACGRCIKLTYPEEQDQAEVAGVNLSASGACTYSCPDCFAKRLLMGRNPAYDRVSQNRKQKGVLKH